MHEDVLAMVHAAIDEVNAQSTDGTTVGKELETPLLAGTKGVDSLTFVNLVVALEEQIHTATGRSVILVDENSIGLQEHPFRTIGTLVGYVAQILSKSQGA